MRKFSTYCNIFLPAFVVFYLIPLSARADNSCPENQHWVRAHHRRAYHRANGTFVSATTVRTHCQNNSESFLTWESKFKDTAPNQWPHKKEKIKTWNSEERERVIEALEELPETLWEKSIEGIYRMTDSTSSDRNPSTSAEKIIVLYDSAFDQSHNLAEILAHELAHEHYRKMKKDALKTYRDQTGWYTADSKEDEESSWLNDRTKFVELDGRESPNEDFANNIQYFLFHPMKLRLFTPNAYDWIQHHFGDKFKIRSENKKK